MGEPALGSRDHSRRATLAVLCTVLFVTFLDKCGRPPTASSPRCAPRSPTTPRPAISRLPPPASRTRPATRCPSWGSSSWIRPPARTGAERVRTQTTSERGTTTSAPTPIPSVLGPATSEDAPHTSTQDPTAREALSLLAARDPRCRTQGLWVHARDLGRCDDDLEHPRQPQRGRGCRLPGWRPRLDGCGDIAHPRGRRTTRGRRTQPVVARSGAPRIGRVALTAAWLCARALDEGWFAWLVAGAVVTTAYQLLVALESALGNPSDQPGDRTTDEMTDHTTNQTTRSTP